MGYGLSSLALPPLTGWAQSEPAAPVAGTIAASTDAAQHLAVNVQINGDGPFRFVVDTGADRTVIADDVAESLGLLHGEQVMLRGIVNALATQTVSVRDFSLGPVRRRHMQLPVLPRSMLQADGYLGLDTIDGSRVTFDFKNRALEIGEAHTGASWYQPRPNETRLRTIGSFGHLRALDCAVAGVASAAFIDTGAEVSVGNSPLLAALDRRHPVKLEPDTLRLTGVTGGEVAGRVTTIGSIRLQELEFTDCALVIADLPVFDIWGLGDKPALLIGMNYLRQFSRVSIDYGLKEIRFELASLMVAQPA